MNCRRFIAFLGSRTTLKHQLSHRADHTPALTPPPQRVKRDFAGLVVTPDDQWLLARRAIPLCTRLSRTFRPSTMA
jgi:hypothetical protein